MTNTSVKEEIVERLLDAKLMTAAGGILLSALLGYFYFKTTTNHIEHNQNAVDTFTSTVLEINRDNNEIQREVAGALRDNAKAIESLERTMQQ